MSQIKQLLQFAKPFWKSLSLISFMILVISGVSQIEPLILKQITDEATQTETLKQIPAQIMTLLLFYLGVKIISVIANRLSWYLSIIFSYKLRFSLKEYGYKHLMSLPMGYFNKKQSGQLMNQLERGVSQITSIINNSGMHFVPNLITAIIALIIVSQFNLPITLAMLFAFIFYGFSSYWRFVKTRKIELKEFKMHDTQYGHFWETISAIKLVKSFTNESLEFNRFKRFNQKIFRLRMKAEYFQNLFSVTDIFLESFIWAMYAWVVYLTFIDEFSLGTMVLMLSYIRIIREPLWFLNWVFWEAKRAQIGAKDFFAILNQKPTIKSPANPIEIKEVKGNIEFKNASFKYKKGDQVFENINFKIPAGTSCAFVGKSGTGKTTMVDLLSRFFDITKGQVLIDGINIKKIDLKKLRGSIGMVSQEPYLFADTIENNLKYGNPKASEQEMIAACKIANADEFIDKLAKKYKTKIGERGVRLSGGQKQRLSMARAILENPPILIFDEATSQLDSHSEVLIQEALKKVIRNRTTIFVAHRLSTIQKADQIIVIEKGKILEQGSHRYLLNKKGLYASLFSIQSGNKAALKKWELVSD
jgi:ATP-binding cassette, subfamily B, bacterial